MTGAPGKEIRLGPVTDDHFSYRPGGSRSVTDADRTAAGPEPGRSAPGAKAGRQGVRGVIGKRSRAPGAQGCQVGRDAARSRGQAGRWALATCKSMVSELI